MKCLPVADVIVVCLEAESEAQSSIEGSSQVEWQYHSLQALDRKWVLDHLFGSLHESNGRQ